MNPSKTIDPRPCEECGTEYKPMMKRQRFCQKACAIRSNNRRLADALKAANAARDAAASE